MPNSKSFLSHSLHRSSEAARQLLELVLATYEALSALGQSIALGLQRSKHPNRCTAKGSSGCFS